jgi:hypothetical protein
MQNSLDSTRSPLTLFAAAVFLAVLCALTAAGTADAKLNRGLCNPISSRAQIPDSFAVDACFDGTHLVLHNNRVLAMGVSVGGDVGSPKRTSSDYELAAVTTRALSNDSRILLPGDTLSFPVGSGAASFKLRGTPKGGLYLVASGIQNYIPGGGTAVVQGFTAMMKEVDDDFRQYSECRTSRSRVQRLTCWPLFVRNIGFAGSRFVVHGALGVAKKNLAKITAVVLNGVETSQWADANAGALKAILNSGRITIAGVSGEPAPADIPAPDDPPSEAPAPSATEPTSAPVSVPSGSTPETAGGVTHTWTNYTNAGGTEGPSIQTGQTVGIECKLQGFRVADGNTWWYKVASSPWNGAYYASADAFYNNGQTSGSLVGTPWVDSAVPDCAGATPPPPPPPPPPPTWSETVGGNANTWTNYTNAGGTQGPTIPAYTTVQIDCKLQGFKVADGNTWWYRIASSPWNGQFYVSADAFYNNGSTSGSLSGTPFVDSAVANC